MSGPLDGLKVVELCDERGQMAGKLLGDMGADVVKVEPPGGEASRRYGPFAGDREDANRSLYFWSFNTSKRSLVVDIEKEAGARVVRELMEKADMVLETYLPGELQRYRLGYEDVAASNPGLIYVSITPFGQTGPWADYQASDLISLALAGQMAACGYDDVPGSPPIRGGGDQSYYLTSVIAVFGALAALQERHRSGRGQQVDVSMHEALSASTELGLVAYLYSGRTLLRQTGRHASGRITERWQYRCADGRYVNLFGMPRTARDWLELVKWIEGYGMAEDLAEEQYHSPRARQLNVGRPEAAHCMEVLARFAATLPAEEVFHGGARRGATWGAVRSPEENLQDPHLAKDRRFFVTVEQEEVGPVVYPGGPYRFSATPWGIQRPPPRLAEHSAEVLGEWLGMGEGEIARLEKRGVVFSERGQRGRAGRADQWRLSEGSQASGLPA